MSSMTWPDHLLSLDEWAELPIEENRHCELVEGVLLVSPRPSRLHQWAILSLAAELNAQLTDELTALPESEVVISGGAAATVRVPDILVTRFDLIDQGPTRLSAADVLLVVEVLSPGSGSTDRVLKAAEYARAGIGSYWIVDLDATTVTVFENTGGVYSTRSDGPTVHVTQPASLQIDLPALLTRR